MLKETRIKNPILPGFHADPSICKVGDDYYIATSTFQWFPGVEIWHSKNLINWDLVDRPLNRVDQLDIVGIESDCGVWAPCLSYDKKTKKFFLVYTIVSSWTGNGRITVGGSDTGADKEVDCYVVSTDKIGSDWSKRTYLNSAGFDQSFFHDGDKTYLLTMEWVNEMGEHPFNGIFIQEYDKNSKKLIGDYKKIWGGSPIQLTEGPHIYKKNGYYYLLVAEGGSSYSHSITMARSKNLFGDYEIDPNYPTITAVNNKHLPLQKSGHGSFVEDESGNVWLVSLVGRPLGIRENCPLGRETAIYRYKWNQEGWLENYYGKNEPNEYINVPFLGVQKLVHKERFNFDKLKKIPNVFQTGRTPIDETWANITQTGLVIRGRKGSQCTREQSILCRRWRAFNFDVETMFEFNPKSHKQSAGLMHKYDEAHQMLMKFTILNNGKKAIKFELYDRGTYYQRIKPIEVPETIKQIWMKSTVRGYDINFLYSLDGINWNRLPKTFDTSILSDDYIFPISFTGAFTGIFVADQMYKEEKATFKYFEYKEMD